MIPNGKISIGPRSDIELNRPPLSVVRVAAAELPTLFGHFQMIGYRSLAGSEEFVALAMGQLRHEAVLVRIHSQCLIGEVFCSRRCDCGAQPRRALEMISADGHGALVYQLQEGRGIGLLNKVRAYALQDEGADTVEANERWGFPPDMRDYRQCSEILVELGISRARVMTNNPRKLLAIKDAGLKVVSRVPLQVEPSHSSMEYLRTKMQKLGHLPQL